ncbi:hypothetical protein MNEG_3707 [Monoraphidium neglectum]|uniref:Uncharacterized protein n=1 Tax=Monoraphidium neglectum TaxID=145388 RepID=A0A0D2MNH4_9CHLO|nr:hypothetical protein MNEG_3707 [Monoraphidium neglectum]KIZ04255.1 hypothetical protein MNEG_3707 [Monoraphidium neglectum]|eukprot:XP_013903274.1 hypothetical protein MNEG_3707 [Monoraphidium neglectum]
MSVPQPSAAAAASAAGGGGGASASYSSVAGPGGGAGACGAALVGSGGAGISVAVFQVVFDQQPMLLFVEVLPRFPEEQPALTLQSIRRAHTH